MHVIAANEIKFNHPVGEVFKRINVRMPFHILTVFEPFAGDGLSQTINYAYMPIVGRLVGWEMDPLRAKVLKNIIPGADVKICDAFHEVHNLQPHFDVILIDNNLIQVPFEHFDLFPAIFKGLKPESFLVVSVCHSPGTYYVDREKRIRDFLGTRVESWVKDWDCARCKFYGFQEIQETVYKAQTGRIMPASDIPANDMVPVYMEKAVKAGFFTNYHTVMRRSKSMSYIVLELRKTKTQSEKFETARDRWMKDDAEKNKTY